MIRSKIDEIKLLRSTNFTRPTTSNFLSPYKKYTLKRKEKINAGQIQRGMYIGTPTIHKPPTTINSLNSYTPKTSKSNLVNTCINFSKSPEAKSLNFPFKVQDFLNEYKSAISRQETVEILDYYTIYYWGRSNKATHFFRNEDENGFLLCDQNDHIAYKYQIVGSIGKGTFGQVFEAFDHKTKTKVAIKIIRNQKKYVAQGSNEVKILKFIKENSKSLSYIIDLKDFFIFRNHICIVLELFPLNLFDFLKLRGFKGLNEDETRFITSQLLVSLRHLRKLRIIHSDLKPENILINPQQNINLIDFGSSCFLNEKFNFYIQSRNYRAPEVILGFPYDFQIDIWSLGCIIFELITGKVLFQSTSELEHLHLIHSIKGDFPESVLLESSRAPYFFAQTQLIALECEPANNSAIFSSLLKRFPLLYDFISRCLEIDPRKRLSIEEASFHLWVKSGRLRDDSRTRGGKLRARS